MLHSSRHANSWDATRRKGLRVRCRAQHVSPACSCKRAALQIEGMTDTIKTATAARVNPAEEKLHKANEGFLQDEGGKQQLLLK